MPTHTSMATQEAESETKNVNPLNEEFQKLANEVLEEYHVPGLSIAVIDGDQIYTEVCDQLSHHGPITYSSRVSDMPHCPTRKPPQIPYGSRVQPPRPRLAQRLLVSSTARNTLHLQTAGPPKYPL